MTQKCVGERGGVGLRRVLGAQDFVHLQLELRIALLAVVRVALIESLVCICISIGV